MAQLVVRKVDERVVQKLREAAAREGVSMEEFHRRLLSKSLLENDRKPSFKEFLLSMPEFPGDDALFERERSVSRRTVEL